MNIEDFTTKLLLHLDEPVSDESAWLINEFLYRLSQSWESAYYGQIRRYEEGFPVSDSETPWE